ncbi:MAG: amidase domain-containing protein [Oscillospiraceae bacterium]|nr:amidase domain-containing protein [Oscillospiraceae bacterium]
MQYNRDAAVAYADRWAYGRNPRFFDFSDLGGDCTNFASQTLYAGSGVMNYTPLYGWFYISANDRTPSWTGVNELYQFLVTNTGAGLQARVSTLAEIERGDIIQIRFKGGTRFDHSPVVMDVGMRTPETILLAAHSNDANCRPLSSYNYRELRPLHIVNVGE